MSDLVVTVLGDLAIIFMMYPFSYLTATIVLACIIVLLSKMVSI